MILGRSSPELLRTYSDERQTIAAELIDFDRKFAKMFSAPPLKSSDDQSEGVDPAEFQKYFIKQRRFTAGTATRYCPSIVTAEATYQHLAKGFVIGMRFHSACHPRLADAKPVQFGHTIKADGRWRIFAFSAAEDPAAATSGLRALSDFLAGSLRSPIKKYTPSGADIDSVFDVRVIFQQGHRELAVDAMPSFFRPPKGKYGLCDYEKMFCSDLKAGQDIFDMRGIDRHKGCMVVVRPDQYVAHVLPITAYDELSAFFDVFMQAGARAISV